MYEFFITNPLLTIFIIAFIGYAIGALGFKGLSLGTAAVLLVALVFGHFLGPTDTMSTTELAANAKFFTNFKAMQDIGLVLFVTAVGFIAGPTFFRNFKSHAIAYVVLGAIIVLAGVLTSVVILLLSQIGTDLTMGLLAGALTTTPGLGVALEATGSDVASIGYGIAYPFGVVGVVLFVQLVPRIFKTDMAKEREHYLSLTPKTETISKKRFAIDPLGYFAFAAAIALGILLGKVTVPLPGGISFSLGTSGGPLIAGLVFGHFGHVFGLSLSMKKETLVALRELGLALFLIGAGAAAGKGFVEVLVQHGAMLFVYGAIMTLIPMFVGLFFARKVFKLSMFDSLGSICGGMTSTPALGTLIRTAETDDVATAYAASYPIALAVIVITFQLVCILF